VNRHNPNYNPNFGLENLSEKIINDRVFYAFEHKRHLHEGLFKLAISRDDNFLEIWELLNSVDPTEKVVQIKATEGENSQK
jgi:hypothetical protein